MYGANTCFLLLWKYSHLELLWLYYTSTYYFAVETTLHSFQKIPSHPVTVTVVFYIRKESISKGRHSFQLSLSRIHFQTTFKLFLKCPVYTYICRQTLATIAGDINYFKIDEGCSPKRLGGRKLLQPACTLKEATVEWEGLSMCPGVISQCRIFKNNIWILFTVCHMLLSWDDARLIS